MGIIAKLKTLTIVKKLTKFNFTDKNDASRIKYIVIHYFGSLGTAESVANYFANAYRGSSAHYNLDGGKTVYQSVEDEDIAWHCGTSGKYYHPTCRNSNSIGIEVQPYILDKSKSTDASYRGWYFSQEVEGNLRELVLYLMEKYDVPAENVVRHYDVTHKYCPRPWMGDDVNLHYNETGNARWSAFKASLVATEEDEDMTSEKFAELMNEYRKALRDNDSGTWSEEARQWATDQGLVIGGDAMPTGEPNYMWEDILTREQAAQLFYRFAQMMGKV